MFIENPTDGAMYYLDFLYLKHLFYSKHNTYHGKLHDE